MSLRTRIKICGIGTSSEAMAVADAGADAIGLVFYKPSCRYINAEKAGLITRVVPPFISLVGLFVNHDLNYIVDVNRQVKLSLLQFHGNESPDFCKRASDQLAIPYIKAIQVKSTDTIETACRIYNDAQALLLDTSHIGQAGGTGMTFNWALVPDNLSLPVILAGGLCSDNVESAIAQVKPYAVDVSSGVEQSPGVKSPVKIKQFVKKVHAYCRG